MRLEVQKKCAFTRGGVVLKYQYSIAINCDKGRTPQHSTTFGNCKDIGIWIGTKSACVTFSSSKKYSADDIASMRLRIVPDGLRKAHLLYILRNCRDLDVERIVISAADGKRVLTDGDREFPMIYSMIATEDLGIPAGWATENMKNAVCATTKTKARNNRASSALYSLLVALGRPYEMDRFSGLWTATNACYSYFYEKEAESRGKEARQIAHLLKRLNCGEKLPDGNARKELRGLYAKVGDCLFGLTDDEIAALCDKLNNARETAEVDFGDERFQPINKLAKELGMTPCGLMMLEYPYYWRCRYFHGEYAALIFSEKCGREISILRTINAMLKRLLFEQVPKMFDENCQCE